MQLVLLLNRNSPDQTDLLMRRLGRKQKIMLIEKGRSYTKSTRLGEKLPLLDLTLAFQSLKP